MAALTKADCIAIAPELTAVADATWTLFLAQSLSRINPDIYGTKANMAQAYLTCHLLKTLGFGVFVYDNTGKVTSGNLTPADESDDFDATVYGRAYQKIQRECSVAAGGLVWAE